MNIGKLFLASIFTLMGFVCFSQQSSSVGPGASSDGQSSFSIDNASFSIDPSFMLTASFHGSKDGDWIHRVTQLKVMILDGKKTADAETWGRLSHDLRGRQFEDLLDIRNGKDRLQLMSKEGKDGQKELAF